MTNTLTVLYEQRMKRDFDKKKGFWGLESLGSCRVVVIVGGLLWGGITVGGGLGLGLLDWSWGLSLHSLGV